LKKKKKTLFWVCANLSAMASEQIKNEVIQASKKNLL